ncbi:MAG: hypothetical protein AAGH65_10240, partial [Pseudomonadota bacterium]
MKGKLTLIGLFGLFLAPIMIALVLNSEWVDWRASPDRSHGELIEPVVPLGAFRFDDAGGQSRMLSDLTDRWQLAHEITADCDADCEARIVVMRQIRHAQDRFIPEVGLLLLADQTINTELRQRVESLDPSFMIFDGP